MKKVSDRSKRKKIEKSQSGSGSELILYQMDDGRTYIEVRLEGETVWLTQKMLAELYQVTIPTINEHLTNIFLENEADPGSTIRNFRIVQTEGQREVGRVVEHYNLEAILAVGYRVRSHRGTQFRRWATERLNEYLVKGFTLDDERLKQGGTKNEYFEELLDRIREIRSSERNFYRKVCDIYRTSIDYDPDLEMTKLFFQTVQNKMHWAVHRRTAAEIVYQRTAAEKPYMGLTSWKGIKVRKADVAIAKNYLSKDEIQKLNLIVAQYLDYAELRALEKRPMHMKEWIDKLDAFLRLSDQEILEHAGAVSAEEAKEKAEREFSLYRAKRRQVEDTRANENLSWDIKQLEDEIKPLEKSKKTKPGAGE
jgi:hypothetical protein